MSEYDTDVTSPRFGLPRNFKFKVWIEARPLNLPLLDQLLRLTQEGPYIEVDLPEWRGRVSVISVKSRCGSENIHGFAEVTLETTGRSYSADDRRVVCYLLTTKHVSENSYMTKDQAREYAAREYADKFYAAREYADKFAVVHYPIFLEEDSMKVYEAIVVSVNEQGEVIGIAQGRTELVAKSAQAARDQVLVDYAMKGSIQGGALAGYQVRVREFPSA